MMREFLIQESLKFYAIIVNADLYNPVISYYVCVCMCVCVGARGTTV